MRAQARPSSVVDALPQAVFRRWLHAYEEDTAGEEVYRPAGDTFDASRGRQGMELSADGRFVHHRIAPADGVEKLPGQWVTLAARRIAVTYGLDGMASEGYVFDIVAVDDEVLRIRRLPPTPAAETSDTATDITSAPGGDDAHLAALAARPPSSAVRLVDFDRASLITLRTDPARYVLHVAGITPDANLAVDLVPLVYARRPGYWEIEVVGAVREASLPIPTPYSVVLPVTSTLGHDGVEVVGANRRERLVVSDPPPGVPCGGWTAWVERRPAGDAEATSMLRVRGHCELPTAGFDLRLSRHEPQGPNPRVLLLDLIVVPPSGPAAQVVDRLEVDYQEPVSRRYDQVTILPDGPTLPVADGPTAPVTEGPGGAPSS